MKKAFVLFCLATMLSANARAETNDDLVRRLRAEGHALGWTFDVGVTPMTGLTEFGFQRSANWEDQTTWVVPPMMADLPAKWDWRDQGVVGPVRDQASPIYCGSCWAHGTTASFEAAIAIKTGHLPNLSPQQLVSCQPSYGSCANGGEFAFGFYQQVGANYESDFPYTARDVACKENTAKHERAAEWHYVGVQGREPTTDELKRAIYAFGPVAVTVSSTAAWRSYRGGVYNACDSQSINHIVTLVGWDNADQVWIVKNSHGTQFGEGGYMRSKWVGRDGLKCNALGGTAAYGVPAG